MKLKVRYILFTLFFCLFLFSGRELFAIFAGYRQSEKSYQELSEQFVYSVSGDSQEPLDFSASNKPASTEAALTAKPQEFAPITVDFDALTEDCPNVVAWIYCPDTPINYPVLQALDNSYYLRRLSDGTPNNSGSIFMDSRCMPDFSGWNTILYGHNMKNGTMFGTLEEYRSQEYYDAHPVLYLLTMEQNYQIALIGGYTTSGDATNANGFPQTQAERDGLITTAQQRSTFQSTIEVADGERIITLSTCAYDFDGARYVLVGILREIAEMRQDIR